MRLGSIAVTPSPPQIANQKSAKDAPLDSQGGSCIFTELPARSHQQGSSLPHGVNQFQYSREMVIVMFGDKIQMVYKPHRHLQTRVRNSSGE
jgi:hypothetical protein